MLSALGINDTDFVKREVARYGLVEPDSAKVVDLDNWAGEIFSYLVGVAFGRWNVEFASGDKVWPEVGDPFSPVDAIQPGRVGTPRVAASSTGEILDSSILVNKISLTILKIWESRSNFVEQELLLLLGLDSLSKHLDERFFQFHLSMYSRSRRSAPIYWPISTASGGYTLWIYYPDLTSQTLYTAVNDFLEPKLKQVSREAATLRVKGSARSRDEEKLFESLQTLEFELMEIRDILLQIAPTYRPTQDDGVQITAAPLWQLFRHKPWQKILKDTWSNLEKGDYDWAHLAMAYWPDRVLRKCKTDKSLAIAHDLEHLYVEPEPKAAKARGRKKDAE